MIFIDNYHDSLIRIRYIYIYIYMEAGWFNKRNKENISKKCMKNGITAKIKLYHLLVEIKLN